MTSIAEQFFDELAARVAAKVVAELRAVPVPARRSRLLGIPEAAIYMGRSTKAVRHLLKSGVLRNASPDRRVQIDIRDLDILIANSKR